MGFVKVKKDELRYAVLENLIGLPLTRSSNDILQTGIFDEEKKQGAKNNLGDGFQREVLMPVKLEKIEQFELDKNYGSIDRKLNYKIELKNPGKGDKVWDIKLNLKDPKSEGIGTQYLIQELNPQEEWTREFSLDAEVQPPITIRENVSNVGYQFKSVTRASPILLKNVQNYLFFTIILENASSNELYNLEIYKQLPNTVLKVVESKSEIGT